MKLTHAALLLIAGSVLAACQTPAASANPVCGAEITDTSAWINMMPGPGGPPGNLVVMAEVEADGISRRFEKRGLRDDGTLELDVVEWGPKEGLNRIVYRTSGVSPERIEIFCGGALMTSIEDVTVAQ